MNIARLNDIIAELGVLTNEQIRRAGALQIAIFVLGRGDDYREVDTVDLISCASWLETGEDPYGSQSPREASDAMTWTPGTAKEPV